MWIGLGLIELDCWCHSFTCQENFTCILIYESELGFMSLHVVSLRYGKKTNSVTFV